MAREKGDQQYTDKNKLVGKQQLYAILVDAAGDPVLDTAGNTQVIELGANSEGRLQFSGQLEAGTNIIGQVSINQAAGKNKVVAELSGSNVTDGTGTLEATFEKDTNGNGALRVVDAAPFAYDETTDSKRIQVVGAVIPTHSAVDVTTASTTVLAANANRKSALIVNNSDAEIFLNLAGVATVNAGILLISKGSSFQMSAILGNLTVGAITGIHASTGNKQVLVTEGV